MVLVPKPDSEKMLVIEFMDKADDAYPHMFVSREEQ